MMRRFVWYVAFALVLTLGGNVTTAQEEDGQEPAVGANPVGEPIAIYNTEGDEVAQITATTFVDPFEDYSEFSEPDEGERFVFVTLDVQNTGERPFEFSPYTFNILDSLGRLHSIGFVSRNAQSEEEAPELEDANMLPEETLSGGMTFRVPEDAELTQLVYTFYDDQQHLYLVADISAEEPEEQT